MKFRKSFCVGALILLELILLLCVVWKLNSFAAYVYGAMEVLSVTVVVLLIYSRDNPSYKLSWAVVILVFPLFGVFIYFVVGTHYLSPRLRKNLRNSRRFNRLTRCQKPQVLDELHRRGGRFERQARFILNLADKPVYTGTQARLLTPGEEFFQSMLEELRGAQKFIFLEFFILAEGSLWDEIFSVLKQKAAEGVEVRILYDDAGSMDRLPHKFRKECAGAGINAVAFNPFMPVLNKFMAYRDHRKIVVVDGNTAFTGGINIGDEYVNRLKLHGHWKDTGVLLRGEAVWSFTVMFLDMWILITNEPILYDRYRPCVPYESDGFVQPFSDSPFTGNVSEGAYMQAVNTACRYAYIMTPYLILDHEMTIALCNAARSGVDVRIVTPHVPDKRYVHSVTRGYYDQLMDCGVKIYEYIPGFIHSKVALSDDEVGIVGSVNMDYRSFYLQFEDAVFFCGGSIIKEIKADFSLIFEKSLLIDPAEWKKRPLPQKIIEIFLRLFAPLM